VRRYAPHLEPILPSKYLSARGTSAPRKGLDALSGQFLIPISSAESSPFVERVQYEFGYYGVYFQCLSDWHDTCLSKGLRSAGGRLLSRWHAAREVEEWFIHAISRTSMEI
jgi:hypothetical protein